MATSQAGSASSPSTTASWRSSLTFSTEPVRGPQPATSRQPRQVARVEQLLERRAARVALFVVLIAIVAAIGVALRSRPNYDSYYALVWGREIAHGHLPDYNVFRSPTPHPLFNLYTAVLTLTGSAGDEVLTVLSLGWFLALLVGAYEMVRLKVNTLVAVAAVAILLTRTDLVALALRSLVDVPFLTLVVWAVVLELSRPRRGAAPLVLLALAGLLRPEAWILSGLYWVWIWRSDARDDWRRLVRLALLIASAPVIWLGLDLWVTGNPLYSFVSTREVAGELARQKSPLESLALAPRYVGGSEPIVNGIAGVFGIGLAIYALRERMFMLSALAGAGLLTYVLIALGGLSVIPRYLLLTSIVACIGVAFALAGWTHLDGTARRVGRAGAVFTVLLMAGRVPAYVHNYQRLSTESAQVRSRIGGLSPLLRSSKLRTAVKTCKPLLSPTHEAVPVLRYDLDLAKREVVATTSTHRAPTKGVQLLQSGFLDPVAQTNISHTLRKSWTSFPLPGFTLYTSTEAWLVYSQC